MSSELKKWELGDYYLGWFFLPEKRFGVQEEIFWDLAVIIHTFLINFFFPERRSHFYI